MRTALHEPTTTTVLIGTGLGDGGAEAGWRGHLVGARAGVRVT